jgi:hypothetical protein
VFFCAKTPTAAVVSRAVMRVRVRMKMRRGQARRKMKGNKMTNFILNVQIRYDYLMFKPIVGVKTGMGERE